MTRPAGGTPALFLDRDGVINEDVGFLWQIEQCRFVDGIFDLARNFVVRGFLIVVATNQSGIGRGLFSEADFRTLMDYITAEFVRHGAPIAAIYHAPDHPTEGVGRYRRDSSWRKPRPGMMLAAQQDLGLDLARSWSIGDEMRDVVACRDAGVGTLVLLDRSSKAPAKAGDLWVVPRLTDALALAAGESVR
ncbi:MAG: HAD family hydrolase [Alphaproteobacteria bacterium]|nr:HAD family hydrolase [Alphaproteobacteria bacterium]